ncbi:programmed cell death protein 2-like [Heterodontus francisci]|uniref:programmed cell death protein 2-like n=1 Tax=Heterodontus francisci TaxID=7792 RepID=UPI00355B2493
MSSATGPGPRPVLLGIRDAAIEERGHCAWDTNKVGATPDCVPGITMQYPHCTHCSDLLIHLVQVYCPLEGSSYHRTINVLACLRRECWGKSDSWKVLRSQCQETKHKQEATAEKDVVAVTTKDWCDEADNWGVDDSPGHSAEGLLSLGAVKPPPTISDTEIGDQATRLEGLNLLEKPEGKGLLIQTPVPVFQPFYISVMEEEDYSLEIGFSHERKLLHEYQRREGVNVEQLNSCEDNGGAETYEKGKARHGDRTFVKFMKQIASCPQQILRYCWNGIPLLLSSPAIGIETAVPECESCGSPRVFEFQLMPALVNMLRSTSGEEISVEFGTVLIYTCERSCWTASNQTPVEECAFVQGDPDQRFFR